jgi:hypothetical protein
MAPKNKGKKSKNDDDDFWSVYNPSLFRIRSKSCNNSYRAKAGTSVANNNLVESGDTHDVEEPIAKASTGFSSFASLGMMDGSEQVAEEDEDFGGLMVRFVAIQAFVMTIDIRCYILLVDPESVTEEQEG